MSHVFVRMVSAKFQNHPSREKPDHIFQFSLEYPRSETPLIVGVLDIPVRVGLPGTEMLAHAWEQAALTLEAAAEFARKAADGAKAPTSAS